MEHVPGALLLFAAAGEAGERRGVFLRRRRAVHGSILEKDRSGSTGTPRLRLCECGCTAAWYDGHAGSFELGQRDQLSPAGSAQRPETDFRAAAAPHSCAGATRRGVAGTEA